VETDHCLGKQIIQKLGKNLRKMSVISSTKSKLTVLGRNCMNCPKLLGSTVNFDKGNHSKLLLQSKSTSNIYCCNKTNSIATLHQETKGSKVKSNAFPYHILPWEKSPLIRSQQVHTSHVSNIFKTFSTSENKSSQSETKEDNNVPSSSDPNSSTESPEFKKLEEDVAKLSAENEELKTKNGETLDKYRRSIAENDNMRKRLTKQIEDAKVFGIQGFCKDLLEVADVLQKAVEIAKSEDERLGSSLASGIEMTQTQMHQVFNRHGLSKISPIEGETKFDPNMHEALFQIPAPDKDPNIVMNVQQLGYSLHGRTIRPAKVGVSKK